SNQFARTPQIDHIFGGNIAIDLALNDAAPDLDFSFDAAGLANDQMTIAGDIPLKGSLDFQGILELESSFELGVFTECRKGLLVSRAGSLRRRNGRLLAALLGGWKALLAIASQNIHV
ncbi:MAG: hypothetical protein ABIH23_36155, partial [bacterium]